MRDIIEILSMFLGLALFTLILNPRSNTVNVVKASGSTLNTLLQTLTLQGGGGVYNPMSYQSGGGGGFIQ